jgi:hypothetical protein
MMLHNFSCGNVRKFLESFPVYPSVIKHGNGKSTNEYNDCPKQTSISSFMVDFLQQRYRRVTPNHHSGLDIRLPRLHVDGGGLPEPAVALQRAGQGNATHNGRVNL